MRKVKYWKKAAVCAFAVAFLLTACGAGSAKSDNAASGGYYASGSPQMTGNSAYEAKRTESYSTSYAEDSYEDVDDYDEAVETEEEYAEEAEMQMAAAYEGGSGESGSSASSGEASGDEAAQADLKSPNRKIVYTGNIALQTLEYDKSAQSIHDRITQSGGFIESEDTYNEDPYWYYKNRTGASANRTRRNLNITARIPADKFDAFMKSLEEDGQVTNTSVNARNISVTYATHDASRKALEIEKKRLLEMMDKAETVEEMIAVEKRLTQVERDLGEEMTQLSAMDRDVDFSTVYISLQEVFEYSETVVEVTYGERLKRAFDRAIDGFVTFWEDLILFLVETFPFLIMLAIVIVLLVKLHRRNKRRRMEKRARMEEERRKAMQDGTAYGACANGVYDDPYAQGGGSGFFRRRKKREMPVPPYPVTPGTVPASPGTTGFGTQPTAPGTPDAAVSGPASAAAGQPDAAGPAADPSVPGEDTAPDAGENA